MTLNKFINKNLREILKNNTLENWRKLKRLPHIIHRRQVLEEFIYRHTNPKGAIYRKSQLFPIEQFAKQQQNLCKSIKCRNRKEHTKTMNILKIISHRYFEPQYLEPCRQLIYKSNGETYESKFKAITITTKSDINPDDFSKKIDFYFSTKKWKGHLYTIEHINSNIHSHILAEFSPIKLRPDVLLKSLQLEKYFPTDKFNISTKDKKGQLHLKSKNLGQISGWYGYINKEEKDKIIYADNSATIIERVENYIKNIKG